MPRHATMMCDAKMSYAKVSDAKKIVMRQRPAVMATTPFSRPRHSPCRRTVATVLLAAAIAASGGAPLAFARGGHVGGHGLHRGHGGRGSFASGRNASDKYVHAASDELDKLLHQRMKNICRGC
ncbi:MAG: hypothetical protein AB1586_07095 [Pseudomonadota bacterium]|jgi:hypothetical protein